MALSDLSLNEVVVLARQGVRGEDNKMTRLLVANLISSSCRLIGLCLGANDEAE